MGERDGMRRSSQGVHHRSVEPLWTDPGRWRWNHLEISVSGISFFKYSRFYCFLISEFFFFLDWRHQRQAFIVRQSVASMAEKKKVPTVSSSVVDTKTIWTTETLSTTPDRGVAIWRAINEPLDRVAIKRSLVWICKFSHYFLYSSRSKVVQVFVLIN